MCGGGGGAQVAQAVENQAAENRLQADEVSREAAEERALQKRDEISQALSARTQRKGKRGGQGRRSLFSSSSGAAGYLSRFR